MSSYPAILHLGSALRSPSEEYVGALTHGIGMVLSTVGGVALVATAAINGDPMCIVSCGLYAISLMAVYAASTLSHLYLPERWNRLYRRLDQGFIYLLIVGTLTPFAFKFLISSTWFWFYLLCVAVACCGFLSKTLFAHRLGDVSTWLYIALGWGEAIAFIPLIHLLPVEALCWIAAGGLAYTFGTIFLVTDVRRYHFHAIWHLLVILGSVCHYVAVLRFVALDS